MKVMVNGKVRELTINGYSNVERRTYKRLSGDWLTDKRELSMKRWKKVVESAAEWALECSDCEGVFYLELNDRHYENMRNYARTLQNQCEQACDKAKTANIVATIAAAGKADSKRCAELLSKSVEEIAETTKAIKAQYRRVLKAINRHIEKEYGAQFKVAVEI